MRFVAAAVPMRAERAGWQALVAPRELFESAWSTESRNWRAAGRIPIPHGRGSALHQEQTHRGGPVAAPPLTRGSGSREFPASLSLRFRVPDHSESAA